MRVCRLLPLALLTATLAAGPVLAATPPSSDVIQLPESPVRHGPPAWKDPAAHQGPRDVITQADVVLGLRKGRPHGCADVNRNHPENVSHCGWPQIDGMFFNTGETKCGVCPSTPSARLTILGSALNDELLGGTADVTIDGGEGDNVLWADRVPGGPAAQVARISAGDGDNVVYAGPGTNTIAVGRGTNLIHAWQGRGTISCGSRRSVVHVQRRSSKRYRISGCTVTKGF